MLDTDNNPDRGSSTTTAPQIVPTTATAIVMTSTPPTPTSSRSLPEHGSFTDLERHKCSLCINNASTNRVLIIAREKLLVWLPARRDRVLRSITCAYSGRIVPSRSPLLHPSDYKYAASDVETFLENRKARFRNARKKAGYSRYGGGLQWGNEAILQLRVTQIRKMWPECVDRSQLEDAELASEKGEDAEMRGLGMWARTKKKVKRVAKVLGLTLTEKGAEEVEVVKKIGDW